MEEVEICERFLDFLNEFYLKELELAKLEKKESLLIDFARLDRFDPELADRLLEQPEEVIGAVEKALSEEGRALRLRFANLPDTHQLRIRELRTKHMGKLICIEGIVKRASEVRPEVGEAIFLCLECGERVSVIQTERIIRPPVQCTCGKRRFRLVDQRLVDARWIYVEEPYEVVRGEKPSELMIYLKEDLTTPRMQSRTDPGNRIKIVGILKQMARRLRRVRTTQLELYLEANWVEALEVGWEEIEVSPEEERRIKELAADPGIYEKLVASFAPTMYGLDEVKEAIILQLFGGETHYLPDGTKIRGNIHVLLVGDPAAGKCVDGDTKVVLADGRVKKIREIVEENLLKAKLVDDGFYSFVNHNILSLNPLGKVTSQKATIVWKRLAPPKMYQIETETGNKITVTPSHPFVVIEDGRLTYKGAEKLKVGDFLATPRSLPIKGKYQSIKISLKNRKRSKHIEIPAKVTPELCRFIGYVISEGYVSYKGKNKTSGVVEFTNSDPYLLKDFKRCVRKVFGNVRITERVSPKNHKLLTLVICSVSMVEFLEKLEPSLLERSRKKKVPELILMCTDSTLKHLLRAIFEGEVYIAPERRQLSLISPSKELIDQLRILLLRFGIPSQVHSKLKRATNSMKHPRLYHEITVSGVNFERFVHRIGFVTPRRWKSVCDFDKMKVHSNLDTIPLLSNSLKQLRKVLRLSQFETGVSRTTYQHYERGDRNPTPWMLKKIITRFKKRFNEIGELISCIPVIKFNQLKEVRGKLRVSQLGLARLADVSQTLIGWYERGKIKGTSKSFLTFQRIKDILLNLCKKVLSQASYTLRYLELLADSDIFWDRVVRIKLHSPKEKWVYDLQVDETHNFVANNLIVHNSQLMQLATKLMPRARYASGSGITGAGITATVVRDIEFLGGWVLEAGALVLANKSLLALDEFTKISGPDMVRLQEAMSVGTVSIAKATIVATLPADTAILAGANPKLGRFDPYIPIREQIALNEVLLSRFDLRFALKDIPNPELDERMVDHILSVRHFRGEAAKPIVPPDLLRKYIAYARASCHPKLTKEAGEVLKGFYLEMRKRAGEEAPISITLRQYEALVRLAEASARIKLSDRVEVQDAERAIRLMKVSLRQFGLEPETGLIDIDRAEGLRITSAQRSKIRTVFELLEKLEAVHGKQVPLDELKKLARDAGIDDIDDIIRKMMREGLVYSPRVGFLERV